MANRLRQSCERLGYRHRVECVSHDGGWIDTINRKPAFILESLLSIRGPMWWIDADAEILRPLPDISAHDFAVYNWHGDDANTLAVPYQPERLLSSGGVTFWDYTAPAIELLIRWCAASQSHRGLRDDQVLDAVYNDSRPPVSPLWLGKETNWMTGLFGPAHPEVIVRHDYRDGGFREGAA